MQTMLWSPEFFSEGAWEARIKSPLDTAAGTIRATGGEVTDAWTLVQKISDMGEALYGKTEPIGYPDVTETWLSTAGIMGRCRSQKAGERDGRYLPVGTCRRSRLRDHASEGRGFLEGLQAPRYRCLSNLPIWVRKQGDSEQILTNIVPTATTA
jgi:hypothetical protein